MVGDALICFDQLKTCPVYGLFSRKMFMCQEILEPAKFTQFLTQFHSVEM